MKKIVPLFLVILVTGCSGGTYTSLLNTELEIVSPGIAVVAGDEDIISVRTSIGTFEQDPMVREYGASWRNLEAVYPEYTFNP
ncbi:MAG: hypothetical protein KAR13_20105 [Desulfobulbaceae bacterium]|nr:hypothetical protein [Desulfobulbaceae bacterium]MCK5436847.1 hypothetical protein [Desulfobulbaceae bacterium]MCK5544138.1 hypothetical protein [Desulfobulbaceae bacterium]